MKYRKIQFPKDESAHDCIIEWWYWNGNLKDKKGNKYAFMDCLFKADIKKVKIPFLKSPFDVGYFSHSLLSDVRRKKFYQEVNPLSIVSTDSFTKPLLFINYTVPSLKGYTNYVMECVDKGRGSTGTTYHIKTSDIDLTMVSTKRPLLEGGKGFIDLNSDKTYYYSLTNLATTGRIKIEGKWIDVTGKSWMDHQWADVPYKKNKWSWFSIQLNNNTEIVCFEYGYGKNKQRLASISHPDGRMSHYTDITITPLDDKWRSSKTGAEYPLRWEVKIPQKKISLTVSAKGGIKDHEVNFGTINYWEGPLDVKGTAGGRKVNGDGFMELVGYATDYTKIRFLKDKTKQSLNQCAGYSKKVFGRYV